MSIGRTLIALACLLLCIGTACTGDRAEQGLDTTQAKVSAETIQLSISADIEEDHELRAIALKPDTNGFPRLNGLDNGAKVPVHLVFAHHSGGQKHITHVKKDFTVVNTGESVKIELKNEDIAIIGLSNTTRSQDWYLCAFVGTNISFANDKIVIDESTRQLEVMSSSSSNYVAPYATTWRKFSWSNTTIKDLKLRPQGFLLRYKLTNNIEKKYQVNAIVIRSETLSPKMTFDTSALPSENTLPSWSPTDSQKDWSFTLKTPITLNAKVVSNTDGTETKASSDVYWIWLGSANGDKENQEFRSFLKGKLALQWGDRDSELYDKETAYRKGTISKYAANMQSKSSPVNYTFEVYPDNPLDHLAYGDLVYRNGSVYEVREYEEKNMPGSLFRANEITNGLYNLPNRYRPTIWNWFSIVPPSTSEFKDNTVYRYGQEYDDYNVYSYQFAGKTYWTRANFNWQNTNQTRRERADIRTGPMESTGVKEYNAQYSTNGNDVLYGMRYIGDPKFMSAWRYEFKHNYEKTSYADYRRWIEVPYITKGILIRSVTLTPSEQKTLKLNDINNEEFWRKDEIKFRMSQRFLPVNTKGNEDGIYSSVSYGDDATANLPVSYFSRDNHLALQFNMAGARVSIWKQLITHRVIQANEQKTKIRYFQYF